MVCKCHFYYFYVFCELVFAVEEVFRNTHPLVILGCFHTFFFFSFFHFVLVQHMFNGLHILRKTCTEHHDSFQKRSQHCFWVNRSGKHGVSRAFSTYKPNKFQVQGQT